VAAADFGVAKVAGGVRGQGETLLALVTAWMADLFAHFGQLSKLFEKPSLFALID